MKKNIVILFVLKTIGHLNKIQAQVPADSLVKKNARFLALQLHLSDRQESELVQLGMVSMKTTDSLNQLKLLTPEQRKPVIEKLNATYNSGLQKILTTEQWTNYEKLIAGRKK